MYICTNQKTFSLMKKQAFYFAAVLAVGCLLVAACGKEQTILEPMHNETPVAPNTPDTPTPTPDQTRVWPAGALLDGLYGSYYWENPETGLVERHAIEINEQILHVFISDTSDVNSFPEYFNIIQKINRGGTVSCVVTFSLTRRDAINMLKECPGVYDIEPVGYDRSDSHYPDHLKCFPNVAYLKPISPYTREEIQQLADSLNLIVEENSPCEIELRADHSKYNIVAAANKFHDAALTKSTELLPLLLREGYNDF